MPKNKNRWYVYILECANGRLYTGITTDLAERFRKHDTGRGAMFTRLNRPSHMIGAVLCSNRSKASKLECAVKKLTPQKKHALALSWSRIKNLPTKVSPKL